VISACRRRFDPPVRHKDHMPMSSPLVLVLSVEQEAVLTARVRSWRTEFRDCFRAQIVLAAARGASNVAIAEDLDVCVDTVRRCVAGSASTG
jgi:hypothetical protein